ncbi:MAG: SRPBCC family protein [Cytophagaceae bacterium]|nr:SRPBCC family protein [Cytophagaceae bacterium]
METTNNSSYPELMEGTDASDQNERILTGIGGAALVYFALQRPTLTRLLLTLAGGTLIYRGVTGQWPDFKGLVSNETSESEPLEVNVSQTISRPRHEVYQYWRQLENLPKFMQHLESVSQLDEKRSHWEAKIPGGITTVQWDAEIIDEQENERLSWQSVPGATVENSGEVRFTEAPYGHGTVVNATIRYTPPAGKLGDAVGALFNPAFQGMVEADLTRFKEVMEGSMVGAL